jgi:LysM repeat protein
MTRYHGRHRKPTAAGRTVAKVAVTGMVVGAPLTAFAAPASAAGTHNWDGVAQCESSGNWAANTGNGFFGGLQFTMSTWHAFGGSGSPVDASKSEQVRVAENVLAGQGVGAWPVCGARLTSGTSSVQAETKSAPVAQAAPVQQAPVQRQSTSAPTQSPVHTNTPAAGSYVVKSGDTLSRIATANNVAGGYKAIAAANPDKIQNANLIFPGQSLRLPRG